MAMDLCRREDILRGQEHRQMGLAQDTSLHPHHIQAQHRSLVTQTNGVKEEASA